MIERLFEKTVFLILFFGCAMVVFIASFIVYKYFFPGETITLIKKEWKCTKEEKNNYYQPIPVGKNMFMPVRREQTKCLIWEKTND